MVLVGHAYSGAVIAAMREERVKSLVYVAALAPDENEPVGKVFYRDEPHPDQPKMVPDSHNLVWMPEDAFGKALAQRGFCRSSKHCCRPANGHRSSVRSRAGPQAAMEIKTDMVSGRGRRPHD